MSVPASQPSHPPLESRQHAWVVARLHRRKLELVDDQGARPEAGDFVVIDWPVSPRDARQVLVPKDWLAFLQRALRRQREWSVSQHLEAPVIPLFLQLPRSWGFWPRQEQALNWEYGLELLAKDVVQPVLAARTWSKPRAPFTLPINVLAVDDAARELRGIEESSWYSRPEVGTHGLVVTSTSIGFLKTELSRGTHDVVVARERHWWRVLEATRASPLNDAMGSDAAVTRPRLVILLAQTIDLPVPRHRYSVPDGAALLVVHHDAPVSSFMKDFFYGIFHDLPFHGALREARLKEPTTRAWLLADPATNQNIRISDALRQVEALRDRVRFGPTVGDPKGFIDRFVEKHGSRGMRAPAALVIESLLHEAMPSSDLARQAADNADRLDVDFSRETRGLVPIAETLSRLRAAQAGQDHLRERLSSVAEYGDVIAEVQQRHVDIAMEKYDPSIATYVPIERHWPLRPKAQYRVRLHIGHRLTESLIVGDPPSIDPLLPELEPGKSGHELEVAIFEKDFEVLSPRLVRLYLPALGGSMPVHFVVRTPGEHDAAELRLDVFSGNHLLQAFLLTAEVKREPAWRDPAAVKVELDVATTQAFGNLQQFRQGRALFIGINEDDSGATHRVMIKKDGHAAHPLKIADDVAKQQVDRFRSLLKNYTRDTDNRPVFPTYPADDTRPRPEFDEAVRALAQLGGELYLGIFQQVEEAIHDDLEQIRDAEDLTIQVARHRGNAVFPWSVLYDYVGPSREFRRSAPVCRGAPLPNASPSVRDGLEKWRGCPHNRGREVYCVHGFWGFRHRIEQLTSNDTASDLPSKIELAGAAHAVCLASSITQAAASRLSSALHTSFGNRFVPFPPPSDPSVPFGTFMWTATSRPGVLVLLSHLTNPGSGATTILLVPPSSGDPVILTADQLSQFTRLMRVWKDQPRSLVLLMACESGASTVSTLNDFVMAFRAAGAAAIVGTEVPVYVSLAARFAQELITTLQASQGGGEPTTLGQAVRSVVNQLLGEGNPLGLVFNYCGNADLVLT